MSKLFISYRRKSWPFTHRLADELRARLDAEIFVDFTGIDDTDFEKSILGHLRTSDAVLLVISAETFVDRIHRDDDWVRREIREAFAHHIPLVLVCVDGLLPPGGLPDDIKDVARMQGINFYPEYFAAAVEKLAEFVTKISPAQMRTTPTVQPSRATEPAAASEPPVKQKSISGRTTLSEALDLLENGDHSKAIFLLESLRDSGYQSNAFNIHDLLRKAQTLHDTAERRRIAQINYDDIAELASRKITLDEARAAFTQWRTDYADLLTELDTQKLHERLAPVIIVPKILDILPPPFEWVDIPDGEVILKEEYYENSFIDKEKATSFSVSAFSIGKYPVTKAQYRVFVEAPDGYSNLKWWNYSESARNWFAKDHTRPSSILTHHDHPQVNINWYEAIAFCLWLSAKTGENITLPSEQQWQYAAQAGTVRNFPWGKYFIHSRCNSSVNNRSAGTTSVKAYNEGMSKFGVMDMVGNVWEWCLTDGKTGSEEITLNSTERILKGGGWQVEDVNDLKLYYRNINYVSHRTDQWGFRIVRNQPSLF